MKILILINFPYRRVGIKQEVQLMEKMPLEPAPVLVVKSIFQKIDLNIKKKVLMHREPVTKITTMVRDKVKVKKEVTKKVEASLMLKSKALENLKVMHRTCPTFSHINKIYNRWTNQKFKNCLLMCSLCMVQI